MAQLTISLTATATPAYYELLNTAQAIALAHGEDAAVEWAHRVLAADLGFFIRMTADRKPELRLIQGGKP